MLKKIADWMFEQAAKNTESGSWCVYVDEIAEHFEAPEEWVVAYANEIIGYLDTEKVAEAEFDGTCFDLMLYLDYCDNTKGENNMPNLEINTGLKTVGEYVVEYQRNGNGGIIPVIDGTPHPELLMGYVSERDRDAGLAALRDALIATRGDIPKAMTYMYEACMTAAKGISPDEIVDVDGEEVLIDYGKRKAYVGAEEVANMDDLTCEMPREAIKAILMERARQ